MIGRARARGPLATLPTVSILLPRFLSCEVQLCNPCSFNGILPIQRKEASLHHVVRCGVSPWAGPDCAAGHFVFPVPWCGREMDCQQPLHLNNIFSFSPVLGKSHCVAT